MVVLKKCYKKEVLIVVIGIVYEIIYNFREI